MKSDFEDMLYALMDLHIHIKGKLRSSIAQGHHDWRSTKHRKLLKTGLAMVLNDFINITEQLNRSIVNEINI